MDLKKLMKKFILTVILFFLFVLTPFKYFYIPVSLFLGVLLLFKINIYSFIYKHKYLIIIFIFNFFYLLLFLTDKIYFKNNIELEKQLIIICNFSFRTIFTILLLNFYRIINTFSDTVKILLKFKIPEKTVLILIMFVRFYNIFIEEIHNLVRNYKIKVNGRKLYIIKNLLHNFIVRVYSRSERYAVYFTLKNFNNGENYLKNI